ncbi:MAG: sigma-70 family RNA polymerase sigma factor [Myxococcota bacterium]
MADDIALLSRWREGDDEAGNRLVRDHFRAVFRFLSNKLDEDAADLTQQTFLALVERRDRLAADVSFRAYALGVARHLLLHHLRRHYRDDAVFSPDRMSAIQPLPDPATSPTRKMVQAERRRIVDLALRSLPLDHQIALELHYWNEMSVAEIATVLDCTPGSVKSRLFRARRGLQQQVRRLCATPEPLLAHLDEDLSSLRLEPNG